MKIREACASRRDGVDIGGFDDRMARAAEPIGTLLIGDEEQEIGFLCHAPYPATAARREVTR